MDRHRRHRRTVTGKAMFTALMMLLASLLIAHPAEAAPSAGHTTAASDAASAAEKDTKAVCPPPTPGRVSCMSSYLTAKRHIAAPPAVRSAADPAPFQAPYDPYALRNAYNLPSTTNGQGQTVAIVDAYDNPNLESDLAKYRSHFGLPPCTMSSGCFMKYGQNGPEGLLPKADTGWGEEEDLDAEMVSAICPNCHIVVVEAFSPEDYDMTAAEETALYSGAKFISNSFGSSEPIKTTDPSPWTQHDGIIVTASTGDDGYGISYPAAYTDTVAVGGTSLLPAANNRGWAEITWTGGGSGCSTEPKPSWQPDTGCAGRTVADVSAVANPTTGVAIYDGDPNATNGWGQVGGTSVSAPIIAAVYALAGPAGSAPPAAGLYSHPNQLNDIVAGVNSVNGCSPAYLCKAGYSYDGPTGLGTPNGIGAFNPESTVPTDYTIMGDSYSSGEGTGSYDAGTDTSSNKCHRSSLAFGRKYAALTNKVAVHTACSGATIDNLTTTGQNGEPAQVTRLGSNTRLATVTIGGNDAGFANVLTRCLNPLSGSCEDYYTQDDADNEDNLIDSLEPKLAAAYLGAKAKAPNARIVAVTYPNLFKPRTTCASIANVRESDVQWLVNETFHLDNVIARAAHDAGIELLDVRYAFVGHELCSSVPWVYSLPIPMPSGTKVLDTSAWFHPTPQGHNAITTDLALHLGASPTAQASPMAWTPSITPPGIPTTVEAMNMLTTIGTYTTPATAPYQGDENYWQWKELQGCLTRQRVLRNQAVNDGQLRPVAATPPPPWTGLCPVTDGTWELPYDDGQTTQTATYHSTADIGSPTGIAIDHVVPKADAWYSGMWAEAATTDGQKEIKDFANDIEGSELWAVSANSNSTKRDSRPDEWLPDNTGVRCTYAKAWIAVKYEWALNVRTSPNPGSNVSEMDALQNVLNACS